MLPAPKRTEGPWLDPLRSEVLDALDAYIADSNVKLGRSQVDHIRVMLELIDREHSFGFGVKNALFRQMNQLEHRKVFLMNASLGRNDGYRGFVIGGKLYTLCDFGFPQYLFTPELVRKLEGQHIGMELMRGRRIVGNFLTMPWIKGKYLHRIALFSLSNDSNPVDAWKVFASGGGRFTFNYPFMAGVRQYTRVRQAKVGVTLEQRKMVTTIATRSFSDHMVHPSRIMSWMLESGVECYQYGFQDFCAMMCSEGYDIAQGEFGPFNANDSYMQTHMYYTTMGPGTRFSDYRNTQTWWVKAPTAMLRDVLRMGPDDARYYRAVGIKLLPTKTRVFRTKGDYYYGYLVDLDRVIDVSGHAISMLIMAGFGTVDIGRYWDTVRAISEVALRRVRSVEYEQMIKDKVLTEDALHEPYKVWHSIWDYRAALNAYIVGARNMRYPLCPWVIRITQYKLDQLEASLPELITLKRAKMDALVRAAAKRA